MSNILLRQMREQGLVQGLVFPFARAKFACADAERIGRAVMVVEDAPNIGHYWVMDEADAQRLEAMGYLRYVADAQQRQWDDE